MITGVDVHPKYQANFRPRARDAFVIVKATEGRTVSYPTRPDYVKRFRDAGKIIGHYHWLHTGNIQAQVDWFASKAQVQPGDIIAIDWEHGTPSVPVADVNAAVRLMRARFPQNRLLLYTYACYGPAWAARYRVSVADGLWIADYRSRSLQLGRPHGCDGQPLQVPWFMWQYTTNTDTLDENRLPQFSTQDQMRTWARGLIPAPPPPPGPPPSRPQPTWEKATGADIWAVEIP